MIKLVQLKEDADGAYTGQKIRSLLAPMEYTRLDDLVDIMFTTARDVEEAAGVELAIEDSVDEAPVTITQKGNWQFTDPEALQNKRELIVAALSQREGVKFIKKSRALYWDALHEVRIASTLSKRYTKRGSQAYWYAYHPQWDDFLEDGVRSYLVLGCMDSSMAFVIPHKVIRAHLDGLNTTTKSDGSCYWHIHLSEQSDRQYSILVPKDDTELPLRGYDLPLPTK